MCCNFAGNCAYRIHFAVTKKFPRYLATKNAVNLKGISFLLSQNKIPKNPRTWTKGVRSFVNAYCNKVQSCSFLVSFFITARQICKKTFSNTFCCLYTKYVLLSYFISNEDNWVCEKSHTKYSFLFLMLIFYCKIVYFFIFNFYCKIVLPNVSEFAEIMTCESYWGSLIRVYCTS